jgi:periplasmic protein TonB
MFDTALIESAHPIRDGRRARSLPVAIGLHAAVLAGLILSALLSTGEAPEPQLPMIFPAFFGGPPPPQGDETPVLTRNDRLNPGTVRHQPPPEPVRIPDELPAVADEMPTHDSNVEENIGSGESNGGGSQGSPFGVEGGTGSPSNPPGPTDSSTVLPEDFKGVVPPALIQRIDPVYPEAMRIARLEGTVHLQAVITSSGSVDEVRVIGSVNPILDAAAVSAVRRWLYTPATLNGRTVSVYLTVDVTFRLRS